MTLKLVVVAAALLALTRGVLALPAAPPERPKEKSFQVCNPHLRVPNGDRMEVDVVSYYSEMDSKCLGGVVRAVFQLQKKLKLFEQKEDTAICHGFVNLLSLIDAYHWTGEMCQMRVLEDKRSTFCKRYNDAQKTIEPLVERYDAVGYDDLKTIAETMSALEGEGKCEDFCGGLTNSALCGSFVDASKFFLDKFQSGTLYHDVKCFAFQCMEIKSHQSPSVSRERDKLQSSLSFSVPCALFTSSVYARAHM